MAVLQHDTESRAHHNGALCAVRFWMAAWSGLLPPLVVGCAPLPDAGTAAVSTDGPLGVGVEVPARMVAAGEDFGLKLVLYNHSDRPLAVPEAVGIDDGFGVLRLVGSGGLERVSGGAPDTVFLRPSDVRLLEPGEVFSRKVVVPGRITEGLPGGAYALVAGLSVPEGVTEATGLLYHGAAFSRPVMIEVVGRRR